MLDTLDDIAPGHFVGIDRNIEVFFGSVLLLTAIMRLSGEDLSSPSRYRVAKGTSVGQMLVDGAEPLR